MSSKVQEWLQKGEIIAARETIRQQQHRKPTDIYTIHSLDSADDSIQRAATKKQKSLSSKHQHKKLPSLDSSVIPFAEISPVEGAINDKKQSKQRFMDIRETSEERSPKVDGQKTKDFRRRPRHKMRSSSQNPTTEPPQREKRKAPVKKKKGSKSCHLKGKKQGGVLVDEFSADHLTKDRLTLRPSHSLGIFKKGRASSPIIKGLPDLAFSEMRFLDGRPSGLPVVQRTPPKRKKDKKFQSRKDNNESFSYFESSKKHLEEKRLRVITISSDGHAEPRKRRRKNGRSKSDNRLTEVPVMESPCRPSPRGVMADALRRKGIYSLPANMSSRGSDCSSTVTSGRIIDGESCDDVGENKDIDGRSEYSRVGFQKRFRPKINDYPVHILKKETSRLTTESLKYIKGVHNAKSRERDGSYPCSAAVTARDEKPKTEGTDRASNRATEILRTNSRFSAPKSRCTPEPIELEKIPGSSSPLAALLRVCADSPAKPDAHEKHDRSRDKKVEYYGYKPSRNHQKPVFYPQKSVPIQSPVAFKDCLGMSSRNLGVIRTQLVKAEGAHQEWDDSGGFLHNYSISPHVLRARTGRHPLNEVRQNEKSRDPDIRDQAMGNSSETFINEKDLDYAYNYLESPLSEAIQEQYLPEFGTYEDTWDRENRQESVEGSLMNSSSEHSPECWVDDPDISDLDELPYEERQIRDSRDSYAKTVRRHSVGAEQYQLEPEIIYKGDSYAELELEDPGPKKNFWRKHTL